MKDSLSPPSLPAMVGGQFDPHAHNDLVMQLERFLTEMVSEGHCDIATLKLTRLPTSASGERDDMVYVENGYLKLVGASQASHRKSGTDTITDTNSTVAVSFVTAFADANYAVSVAVDGDEHVWVTSKAAGGFTLNRAGTAGARVVDWVAVPYLDL